MSLAHLPQHTLKEIHPQLAQWSMMAQPSLSAHCCSAFPFHSPTSIPPIRHSGAAPGSHPSPGALGPQGEKDVYEFLKRPRILAFSQSLL